MYYGWRYLHLQLPFCHREMVWQRPHSLPIFALARFRTTHHQTWDNFARCCPISKVNIPVVRLLFEQEFIAAHHPLEQRCDHRLREQHVNNWIEYLPLRKSSGENRLPPIPLSSQTEMMSRLVWHTSSRPTANNLISSADSITTLEMPSSNG